MAFYNWSQTAASNGTADPSINMAEGMAPSAVNDGIRAAMSVLRKWGDDISGSIVTTGTSTAYAVTSNSVFDSLAHMNGQVIAFTPHATNGATVTLNVDGLGAKPLRAQPSVDLQSGVLVQGTPYAALYNSSDAAFYLFGIGSNPGIPLGTSIDYWGTTAPSSHFVLAYGQAISRTTYATLFSLFSTTYGTGDGSTTFNIPDLRGRVVAGLDNMGGSAASRLTDATSGFGDSLGEAGGAQSRTLVTANLPPYTPSGSVSTSISGQSGKTVGSSFGTVQSGNTVTAVLGGEFMNLSASSSFTGTAQGGTSTPVVTVQPTIVANKLLRII